jgi:hypothetical protein
LAIFGIGCNNDTTSTPTPTPTPPSGDLEITDAAEIEALLSSTGWNSNPGEGVSTEGNVAVFDIPAGGSTDNQGFKLAFPADATGYLSLEVTFKVVEVTSLMENRNAKIGFKSAISPTEDVTPYDEHELVFGTMDTALGAELTQSFSLVMPNKLPNNAVWFSQNQYGSGAAAGSGTTGVAVSYKLEITKVKFVGGEAEDCCTDCTIATCDDCQAGECIDECGVECCIEIDLNTIAAADLTFNLALVAVEDLDVNSAFGGTDAVAAGAEASATNIVFSYDTNGQVGLLKLTKFQQMLVLASANAGADLKIDLQGSSVPDTMEYRYALGNPTTGSNWNGSAAATQSVASSLIGEKALGWGTKNAANFGYFLLQQRAAGTSTFTVTSVTIKIVLPEPCEVCGNIPCTCESPAELGELDAALNAEYTRVGTKVFSLADWITGKTEIADPLQKSGNPTVVFIGNGINVTGRTADWNAIDYKIKDTDLAALIVTNKVKITVYGFLLGTPPANSTMILGEPASNYGWLSNQVVSEANGSFKLSYEIAKDYLTKGGDSNEQPQDNLRIQTNGAAATLSFRISLIEVEDLGAWPVPTAATLSGVTANGGATESTSKLTLTFDKVITGLTASHITVTPSATGGAAVTVGALTGDGPSYDLAITAVTTAGNVDVAVGGVPNYTISGSPKTGIEVIKYVAPSAVNVALSTVAADGTAGTTTSTKLTLTFDKAVTGLAASHITVTSSATNGATVTKGALTGSGTSWDLAINVAAAGNVDVTVVNFADYNFTGIPKTSIAVHVAAPSANWEEVLQFFTPLYGLLPENIVATSNGIEVTQRGGNENDTLMIDILGLRKIANPDLVVGVTGNDVNIVRITVEFPDGTEELSRGAEPGIGVIDVTGTTSHVFILNANEATGAKDGTDGGMWIRLRPVPTEDATFTITKIEVATTKGWNNGAGSAAYDSLTDIFELLP